MAITRSVEGAAHVLKCTGRIVLGQGDEDMGAMCDEALGAGARWIVVDLTALTYIDSAGIGALVGCSKRAADRAAVMRLAVAGDGPVRRVLEITQLDRAFDVFGSVKEAVASIPS